MPDADLIAPVHTCIRLHEEIVSRLRDMPQFSQRGVSEARITQGVYLTWDQTNGNVFVDIQKTNQELLSISATVVGEPRWFSLNFELGPGEFREGMVIGLILRALFRTPVELTATIRSGLTQTPDSDTVCSAPLRFNALNPTSAITHLISRQDALSRYSDFHLLLLALPRTNFTMSLSGMKMFVQS